MEICERRTGQDRRSAEGASLAAPFLTKDGLVFSDRRSGGRERRHVNINELLALGEVEEIVLQPVRLG